MTTEHLSPLDQALMKRPRGKPRTASPKADIVPSFPIDYDPQTATTETAKKALTSVKRTWDTFVKLDSEKMDRKEIARTALPALERSAEVIDDADDRLTAQRKGCERAIQLAFERGANPCYRELALRHASSLGLKTVPFVMERIRAGDTTTVSAILNAPAYMSGLTDAKLADLRTAAALHFAPEKVAEIAAVDRDLALIQKAGGRMILELNRRVHDWTKDVHAATKKGFLDDAGAA